MLCVIHNIAPANFGTSVRSLQEGAGQNKLLLRRCFKKAEPVLSDNYDISAIVIMYTLFLVPRRFEYNSHYFYHASISFSLHHLHLKGWKHVPRTESYCRFVSFSYYKHCTPRSVLCKYPAIHQLFKPKDACCWTETLRLLSISNPVWRSGDTSPIIS